MIKMKKRRVKKRCGFTIVGPFLICILILHLQVYRKKHVCLGSSSSFYFSHQPKRLSTASRVSLSPASDLLSLGRDRTVTFKPLSDRQKIVEEQSLGSTINPSDLLLTSKVSEMSQFYNSQTSSEGGILKLSNELVLARNVLNDIIMTASKVGMSPDKLFNLLTSSASNTGSKNFSFQNIPGELKESYNVDRWSQLSSRISGVYESILRSLPYDGDLEILIGSLESYILCIKELKRQTNMKDGKGTETLLDVWRRHKLPFSAEDNEDEETVLSTKHTAGDQISSLRSQSESDLDAVSRSRKSVMLEVTILVARNQSLYLRLAREKMGIRILAVKPGSPAEGLLKEGDLVLSINGNIIARLVPINSLEPIRSLLKDLSTTGEQISLRFEVLRVAAESVAEEKKSIAVGQELDENKMQYVNVGMQELKLNSSPMHGNGSGYILEQTGANHTIMPFDVDDDKSGQPVFLRTPGISHSYVDASSEAQVHKKADEDPEISWGEAELSANQSNSFQPFIPSPISVGRDQGKVQDSLHGYRHRDQEDDDLHTLTTYGERLRSEVEEDRTRWDKEVELSSWWHNDHHSPHSVYNRENRWNALVSDNDRESRTVNALVKPPEARSEALQMDERNFSTFQTDSWNKTEEPHSTSVKHSAKADILNFSSKPPFMDDSKPIPKINVGETEKSNADIIFAEIQRQNSSASISEYQSKSGNWDIFKLIDTLERMTRSNVLKNTEDISTALGISISKENAEKLFEQLQREDQSADISQYFDAAEDKWDVFGLVDDLRIQRHRKKQEEKFMVPSRGEQEVPTPKHFGERSDTSVRIRGDIVPPFHSPFPTSPMPLYSSMEYERGVDNVDPKEVTEEKLGLRQGGPGDANQLFNPSVPPSRPPESVHPNKDLMLNLDDHVSDVEKQLPKDDRQYEGWTLNAYQRPANADINAGNGDVDMEPDKSIVNEIDEQKEDSNFVFPPTDVDKEGLSHVALETTGIHSKNADNIEESVLHRGGSETCDVDWSSPPCNATLGPSSTMAQRDVLLDYQTSTARNLSHTLFTPHTSQIQSVYKILDSDTSVKNQDMSVDQELNYPQQDHQIRNESFFNREHDVDASFISPSVVANTTTQMEDKDIEGEKTQGYITKADIAARKGGARRPDVIATTQRLRAKLEEAWMQKVKERIAEVRKLKGEYVLREDYIEAYNCKEEIRRLSGILSISRWHVADGMKAKTKIQVGLKGDRQLPQREGLQQETFNRTNEHIDHENLENVKAKSSPISIEDKFLRAEGRKETSNNISKPNATDVTKSSLETPSRCTEFDERMLNMAWHSYKREGKLTLPHVRSILALIETSEVGAQQKRTLICILEKYPTEPEAALLIELATGVSIPSPSGNPMEDSSNSRNANNFKDRDTQDVTVESVEMRQPLSDEQMELVNSKERRNVRDVETQLNDKMETPEQAFEDIVDALMEQELNANLLKDKIDRLIIQLPEATASKPESTVKKIPAVASAHALGGEEWKERGNAKLKQASASNGERPSSDDIIGTKRRVKQPNIVTRTRRNSPERIDFREGSPPKRSKSDPRVRYDDAYTWNREKLPKENLKPDPNFVPYEHETFVPQGRSYHPIYATPLNRAGMGLQRSEQQPEPQLQPFHDTPASYHSHSYDLQSPRQQAVFPLNSINTFRLPSSHPFLLSEIRPAPTTATSTSIPILPPTHSPMKVLPPTVPPLSSSISDGFSRNHPYEAVGNRRHHLVNDQAYLNTNIPTAQNRLLLSMNENFHRSSHQPLQSNPTAIATLKAKLSSPWLIQKRRKTKPQSEHGNAQNGIHSVAKAGSGNKHTNPREDNVPYSISSLQVLMQELHTNLYEHRRKNTL